jgi:hypothetical protein
MRTIVEEMQVPGIVRAERLRRFGEASASRAWKDPKHLD